jgi:hypothetical protein
MRRYSIVGDRIKRSKNGGYVRYDAHEKEMKIAAHEVEKAKERAKNAQDALDRTEARLIEIEESYLALIKISESLIKGPLPGGWKFSMLREK